MSVPTMRERMLALVQGRAHDRVPFVQYTGLAAPDAEIWKVLGRENMGLLRWVSLHRFEAPHCRFETTEIAIGGRQGFRRTLHTPEGDLSEERLIEPAYGTSAAVTHFVKTPEDYRVLMAYFRDIVVHKDLGPFYETVRAMGDDGLPHTSVPRTPFQQLWIEWVGIGGLSLHLAECRPLMQEVMALMAEVQRRVFEVVCESVCETPIPYIDFGDNITAPIIGASYFRAYCLPAYNMLAGMLGETGRDVPVYVHMDGDLKPLWDAIGQSAVRGLDSMSPPPDNDTSVAEALSRWPEMRIGINFPSSVHLLPPKAIYAHAMQILEEGGRSGRLQIQISENVPRDVWRVSFPQIAKAIADFARPAAPRRRSRAGSSSKPAKSAAAPRRRRPSSPKPE